MKILKTAMAMSGVCLMVIFIAMAITHISTKLPDISILDWFKAAGSVVVLYAVYSWFSWSVKYIMKKSDDTSDG